MRWAGAGGEGVVEGRRLAKDQHLSLAWAVPIPQAGLLALLAWQQSKCVHAPSLLQLLLGASLVW